MTAAGVAWVILLCGYVVAAAGALIGGPCARCGINHSLPTTDAAREAALDLRSRMVESGRIDVDEVRARDGLFPSAGGDDDPSLAIERLYERRGKMFGVLICEVPGSDSDPPRATVTLKAFAGKLGGQWNLPGWAPIVGRVPESLPVFRRLSAEVTELFGMIDDTVRVDADAARVGEGEDNEHAVAGKVKRLTEERKRLANLALQEVRRHQLVTNFRGETSPITAIYSRGPTKLPGGVGDCAAPKLLAEAARLGLRPTGIAEIFVGATGGMSTTKGDGVFYDACEDRCEQIAGFMLCGLHD